MRPPSKTCMTCGRRLSMPNRNVGLSTVGRSDTTKEVTMLFHMKHKVFRTNFNFTENEAPNWLRYGGREGSTMCNRWFWRDHVLTLEVGGSVDTDFWTIKRIE